MIDLAEVFERRTGITGPDLAMLAELPLFAALPPDRLRALLMESSVQHFARNSMLFLQGDEATRFYVVFQGWVKLFRESADGHESIIGVFARGESFAEAAMFGGGEFPVSATVVDDARLLVIPAHSFLQQLRDNGDLALNILASMSRHLHHLVRQVEQLTARSATERLAEFLFRLCPRQERAAVVQLPLEKGVIAAGLGMQPETLSRSLAKLRDLGVEANGPEIRIQDIGALRAFVESNGP